MLEENTILYKYRADSDNTENIIKDQKVWLSNAANLNDCFECSIQELAKDYISKQIRKEKELQMASFLQAYMMFLRSNQTMFLGMSRKETKHFLKRLRTKKFERQYELVRELIYNSTHTQLSKPGSIYKDFDRQLQEIGIFSMSIVPDNELMWAHYANENKGLVLGFKAQKGSALFDATRCIEVNYSDEMPKCETNDFLISLDIVPGYENTKMLELGDPTLHCAIANKSTQWRYEREWRYIERTSGLYDFLGELCEIIFGVKCPQVVREKYINLTHEHITNEVKFFEIIKVPNQKRLEVVSLPIK